MTSDKFGGWHGWRKSSYSTANGGCVEVGAWRKSSYSDANGGCVEVGAWRKSTYSAGNSGCVEVGADRMVIGIRDTQQHGNGPLLAFPAEAWRGFLAVMKADYA